MNKLFNIPISPSSPSPPAPGAGLGPAPPHRKNNINLEMNTILQRDGIYNEIKNILNSFEANHKTINFKKGIYIYGSPGCGKTQFVIELLTSLNYDIIKYDAGDVRNKSLIDTITSNNISNRNVLHLMNGTIKKIAIVMDEIDGMNNGDKGGITSLIKLIRQKKTKKQKSENITLNPIICIGNYYIDKKIKELMKVCNVFKLDTPTTGQIDSIIQRTIHTPLCDSLKSKILNYIQGDLVKLNFIIELHKKNPQLLNEEILTAIFIMKSYNYDAKKITHSLINKQILLEEHANFMNETDRTIVSLLYHENIVDALRFNYCSSLKENKAILKNTTLPLSDRRELDLAPATNPATVSPPQLASGITNFSNILAYVAASSPTPTPTTTLTHTPTLTPTLTQTPIGVVSLNDYTNLVDSPVLVDISKIDQKDVIGKLKIKETKTKSETKSKTETKTKSETKSKSKKTQTKGEQKNIVSKLIINETLPTTPDTTPSIFSHHSPPPLTSLINEGSETGLLPPFYPPHPTHPSKLHNINTYCDFYMKTMNNICYADYIDRITFQNQIWVFNEMSSLIKTFYNNYVYHKIFPQGEGIFQPEEVRFTKVLTKYSTEYNNQLFIYNFCQELNMDKRDMKTFFQELRLFNGKTFYNQTDKLNQVMEMFETLNISKLDVKRMYRFLDKNVKMVGAGANELDENEDDLEDTE